LDSYEKFLQTRIGDPSDDVRTFDDVDIGAQTSGEFLEVIIANEFTKRGPWRRVSDSEKDIVNLGDEKYSTELEFGRRDSTATPYRSVIRKANGGRRPATIRHHPVRPPATRPTTRPRPFDSA